MTPESIYTPEGSFSYLMALVLLTLVAAVVFLLAFTGASVPI